jgi:adenylate cyclase
MYSGEGTRLLNPYGPAGTMPSVGYDEVLTAPVSENVARFGDRAVFVGYGETSRTEQVEHFSTVYSRGGFADLSGVEIAATAFSNLVDDRTIRELPSTTWLWLTFLAGFLVFVVCQGLGNRIAVLIVVVLAGTYLAIASYFFSTQQLWIPIMLPLAVALPIGMLSAFGLKFWSCASTACTPARRIQSFRTSGCGRAARTQCG